MYVLKVNDMMCEKCVERITKALNEANLTNEVSLENKTVTIDGCEKCLAKAKEILDDLGFEEVSM